MTTPKRRSLLSFIFTCLLIFAWFISSPSFRDFQGISYCFVTPFSLIKVSISVSWFSVYSYLRKKYNVITLQKTKSFQLFYTDFCIIIFAVQNLQHPYLSYCIPCHRLPLRSLHWPRRDQKGILNIHSIICLRGIPGPARLVWLSLFFLLLPFCYGTVFTLPVLRDRFVLFVGVFPTLPPSS